MPRPGQPQRQCPNPRRVDQPAAVIGNAQQLGGHGGVSAAVVAADLGGRLALLAEQGVDERRLADTAGPEEGDGPSRPNVVRSSSSPSSRTAAGHQDGHTEGDLLQLTPSRLGIVDEVALGEQHDRVGTAVERQHELALEAALVRRARRRSDRGTRHRCWPPACGRRLGRPRTMPGARTPSAARARARPVRRQRRRTTQSPTATSAPMLRTRGRPRRRSSSGVSNVLHPRSMRSHAGG